MTPISGKTTLSGMGDRHLLAVDLEVLALRGGCGHAGHGSYAALSGRGATVVTYCGAMPKLTELPFQAAAKIQQYAETRRGRAALCPQDVRSGRAEAGAAAEHRRVRRRYPALGRVRHDSRAERAPHSEPHGGRRRRRRDHLQGARRRRSRRRQRPAGDGGQGRRRGGDPGPQPSLVPDRRLRRRPRRRPHHPAQQRVLRAADQGGVRARGRQGDHLRRRVHQGRLAGRTAAGQAARAGHQPRQGRAVGQHGRDAGRTHRAQQQQAGTQGDEALARSSS